MLTLLSETSLWKVTRSCANKALDCTCCMYDQELSKDSSLSSLFTVTCGKARTNGTG